MGPLVKYTDNLILRVEDEFKAREVLKLYQRNRYCFERFEPTRPVGFYTLDYHATALRREFKAYQLGTFLRYYIYKDTNNKRIIGAVNFNIINDGTERYAEIGYKVDAIYQNQGVAYAACKAGIQVMMEYYDVTRIDARIHPDNYPSQSLAAKLGFKPVRLEPRSANVMGQCVDLIRYSLATSDIQ